MNTALPLGRILGVRLRVHWSALVIAALLVGQLTQTVGGLVAAAAVAGFLISIVAHEYGHALTARQFGVNTEYIQLWALGGVAKLDRESPSPKAEGWIAAAGPLVSLALALVFGWVSRAVFDPLLADWRGLLLWLAIVNLFVAIFNLLPGSPLDGGRILKAVLWAIHGKRHLATRQAANAGMVIAALIGIGGVWLTIRGGGGWWIVLTAAFLWVNARVEAASAELSEQLTGVTVGDLTWYGVADAGVDMDADSMLWQRGRLGAAGGVTVTDPSGTPLGLVLEDELWAIPSAERPLVMLTQLLIPFESTTKAHATDELSSVLRRLNPRRPLVTVWDGARLVGMIPPKKLKIRLGLVQETG